MTSLDHLNAAREHLCHAMGAAEEERREAEARHYGGYFNTAADDAANAADVARQVHSKLDRLIQGLGGL